MQKALIKLKGQLWYLNVGLVGLSLFSDYVLMYEMKAIISALQKSEKKIYSRRLNPAKINSFQTKISSNCATSNH